MESLYGAVVLSRGSTWNPQPWERPYLLPRNNGLQVWPTTGYASAKIVFTDSSGGLITQADLEVRADGIYPNVPASVVDLVPAGANFVITLKTLNATNSIRHGQVIRKEPFYAGAAPSVAAPLSFADSFQGRTALGSNYIPVLRTTQMVDNSDATPDLPTGVACASSGATSGAAFRVRQQFTTDSFEIGITVLNRNPTIQSSLGLIFAGDINFESGLCMQLNAGSSSVQKTHIGTLTAPGNLIDEAQAVSDSVANLDYYLIRFIEATATVSVYKNSALDTPLIQWADTAGIVPKGNGYRNFGAYLQRANTSTKGIQLVSITARDAA